MLGADTTAPIFNGEEIRARHTTQVHKVAGKGYRFDVGGLAFWAGVTGRPPWSLGLGMGDLIGLPHGMCQLSHKRFAPSCGRRGGL